MHWFDRDYDAVSRVPPFRGMGQDEPVPSSALGVLVPFGLGIVVGYIALSAVLPKAGR